jgi:hypothetical protein
MANNPTITCDKKKLIKKKIIKKNPSKNKSNPIKNRPTFYLDDEHKIELRAGGVLFYKYNTDKTNFDLLLIYSRNNYEDFGGCTDEYDKDIIDTVSREVEEESNNIFSKDIIKEKIKDSVSIYIKHCKYALYFIELHDNYDPTDFGNMETHDNISRTVEWVPYDNFNDQDFIKKLNFRLKSFDVLNHLKTLLNK